MAFGHVEPVREVAARGCRVLLASWVPCCPRGKVNPATLSSWAPPIDRSDIAERGMPLGNGELPSGLDGGAWLQDVGRGQDNDREGLLCQALRPVRTPVELGQDHLLPPCYHLVTTLLPTWNTALS